MPKAVRFGKYGGVDVLKVVEVPPAGAGAGPGPGPGQGGGINPGEAKIREGLLHSRWPGTAAGRGQPGAVTRCTAAGRAGTAPGWSTG